MKRTPKSEKKMNVPWTSAAMERTNMTKNKATSAEVAFWTEKLVLIIWRCR